jgi:DNA excision repair protein ERCC-2
VSQIYFRHEKLRTHQAELLHDSYDAFNNGNILLAHAPVGLGKTDAVFGAAISAALENDLTIFFLTPKISQHKMAIEVVKGLAEKYKLDIMAVDLVGRRNACLDEELTLIDYDGFYLQCEKRRKNKSCRYYGNAKGYNRPEEVKAGLLFKRVLAEYGAARTHAEIMKIARMEGACPYELSLSLAKLSNIIICDYTHLFIPSIRGPLLAKIKKHIANSIVIVDEAHNLGKRIREHLSVSLNSYMLRRAEKEIAFLGADKGTEKISLVEPFEEWAYQRVKQEKELIVSKLGFENFLHSYGESISLLAAYLEDLGLRFIERTNKKSACLRIANFIRMWNMEEEGSVRILRNRNGFFSLSKRMLDPSIATKILNDAKAAVLMSGTLKPLEMHRDILGIDASRVRMKCYHSPFNKGNKINIITEKFTTRFTKRDIENYRAMAHTLDAIVDRTPGGVAVFFASYHVQNAVVPLMRINNLLLQQENMRPEELNSLLSEFRKNRGVLCGVQGGSLSEGIDYPNEEIKTVVVVGVALEEKGVEIDALIDYYEEKFKKGWEYGYIFPAVIRGVQAAGRGIRKESDRCAVVLMDERFKWKKYRDILDNNERYIISGEPEKHVSFFWKKNGLHDK